MAIVVSTATNSSNNPISLTSNDADNWFYGVNNLADDITYSGQGKLSMLDVSNGDKITLAAASTGYTAKISGNTLILADGNTGDGDELSLGGLISGESVIIKFNGGDQVTVTAATSGSNTVYTAVSNGVNVTLDGTAKSIFGISSAPSSASLSASQAQTALDNGTTYAPVTNITITDTGVNLAPLAPNVHALGGGDITLDASDNAVSLTRLQATNTLVYGGVAFASSDVITISGIGNPMSLAPSLVELGGESIKMDVDVDTSGSISITNGTDASPSVSSGQWYFNTSSDILTYWDSSSNSAKAIALAGVDTVGVAGAGLMTLDLYP